MTPVELILVIALAVSDAAIIALVIALTMTLRARGRTHAFSWQRTPEVLPNRGPRRGASVAPQRAEAVNPAASAPGLSEQSPTSRLRRG